MNDFATRLRHRLNSLRAELEPRRSWPDKLLRELFHDKQFRELFPDELAFVDMVPNGQLKQILRDYKRHRHDPGFELATFISRYFESPITHETYTTDPTHSIEQHINALWPVLERQQIVGKGSLIGLPHSYMVAGGRFQSMYYWDSYFIMLGLAVAGRWDMVEHMVKNFAFLLRHYGHIPNGNRTYYVGRSQPPFFALMVQLLAYHKGKSVVVYYLPYLLLEHHFWIKGSSRLREDRLAKARAVRLPGGEVLNRYFDNKNTPRPEGYYDDLDTVLTAGEHTPDRIHLDLRAAAESGWDFSARWCKDPGALGSIHTTDIVPVDLNCLLVVLEQTIAKAYDILRSPGTAKKYRSLADRRAAAINTYCWDPHERYYFDYDFVAHEPKSLRTAAAVFPLFAGVASTQQANDVAKDIQKHLLKPGGLMTTTVNTGQQWDAPNGWPPLQWIAIQGLRDYGYHELANDIKKRWIATNELVFKKTGKLVEKYNVVDPTQAAGGGEYPLQDGFGWTNGVLLALLHEDELRWKL